MSTMRTKEELSQNLLAVHKNGVELRMLARKLTPGHLPIIDSIDHEFDDSVVDTLRYNIIDRYAGDKRIFDYVHKVGLFPSDKEHAAEVVISGNSFVIDHPVYWSVFNMYKLRSFVDEQLFLLYVDGAALFSKIFMYAKNGKITICGKAFFEEGFISKFSIKSTMKYILDSMKGLEKQYSAEILRQYNKCESIGIAIDIANKKYEGIKNKATISEINKMQKSDNVEELDILLEFLKVKYSYDSSLFSF